MRIGSLVFALVLCGCAMVREIHGEQRLDDWAKDNELLAESGKIAWSDYYSQYLHKASATPMNDQGLVVERLGILTTAAKLYEQGRLSREDFDAVRAIIRRYETIDDAAANAAARAALVKGLERARDAGADGASSRAPGG